MNSWAQPAWYGAERCPWNQCWTPGTELHKNLNKNIYDYIHKTQFSSKLSTGRSSVSGFG